MLRATSSSASGSGSTVLQKLASTAIPFIIAPTGTMANNGAITLGTALPLVYPSCYLNLPANAIQAGSAAGWYYAVMSSTTVGQVFNNVYTTGLPTIPASPTAFATTGPGAFTGVTTAVTGPSVTVPANALGPNGVLRASHAWSFPGNANNKTVAIAFGGTTIVSTTQTANLSLSGLLTLANRGVANAQVGGNSVTIGATGISVPNFAINTAVSQPLAMVGTMVVATDFIIMESLLIEVIPG